MAYRRSYPLRKFLSDAPASISTLVAAHRYVAEIQGAGRPAETGRRLGHAYALLLVADFQTCVRGLHDLTADALVEESGADFRFGPALVTAATYGRWIDRGNAGFESIRQDFRRLGIEELKTKMDRYSKSPKDDRRDLQELISLRNALAHGNEQELGDLRRQGIADTRTWASERRAGLNRFARALDHVVWDHLRDVFGSDPW